MENTVTLKQLLPLVQQLPLMDRVHLIALLAPQIERDLRQVQPMPRQSLRGLWRGLKITESEVDAIREEMWRGFPREDI